MDDFDEHLRRELPALSPEDEDRERRYGQEERAKAREFWEQVNGPAKVIGVAIEDSIEDLFTGEITVRFRI